MNHSMHSDEKAHACATIYKLRAGLQSLLLLAMRGYWGYLFILAGLQKFSNLEATAGFLAGLGFPLATANAYLVAALETIGGLCLLVGYRSKIASLLLTITMAVAYATAHRPDLLALFSEPSKFVAAPPFHFLLTCLLVLAFGPGKASIDSWLHGSCCHKTRC